jgi:hypothetical protein
LKKTIIFLLLLLALLIPTTTLFGSEGLNDVVKDGFVGHVKSVGTLEVSYKPSEENPEQYIESDEKQVIFYAKYDENGNVLNRMVDFGRYIFTSQVNLYSFKPDNIFLYYLNHYYDHYLTFFTNSFNAAYIYNDQKKITEIRIYRTEDLDYKEGFFYKDVNLYDSENRISEKNMYRISDDNDESKAFFDWKLVYQYDPKNNKLKQSLYNKGGKLDREITLTFDKSNNVIEYVSTDANGKIKLIYDKNNRLNQIDECVTQIVRKKDGKMGYQEYVKRSSKFTYDKNGFISEKDIQNFDESSLESIKYEYTLDQNGNPLTVKTFVLVEKFGKRVYQPITIQYNKITYY